MKTPFPAFDYETARANFSYTVPEFFNFGFDVVDKTTGRWMHVPNQRTAKWNATVWTRLRDEFDTHEPLAKVPKAMMAIVPKTKETT